MKLLWSVGKFSTRRSIANRIGDGVYNVIILLNWVYSLWEKSVEVV